MNHCRHLLALVLVILCGCSGNPPPDSRLIQGEWVVVDFQSPNAEGDRSQRRKHAIISEGTWSQQFRDEQYEDFEYTLDPTKTPKQLDLTYTTPDNKRLTVRAIYEFQHDQMGDRLRVCLGSPPVIQKNGKTEYVESVRPSTFEPKTGALIAYRRKTE